ncbi:4'-phosphopantetheinyl transferase family protein [Dyella sp. KRB-257]|uniref:4'-phosphopantetheinyl transferase family protein n=1 Tax=Dyella sp. KRB-257 TaxID=3400915 RepID=UPI003BFC00FF
MSDHPTPTALTLAEGLHDDEIHVWSMRYERAGGRAPLRRLLAVYLDLRAEDVTLVDTVHGRPELHGAHRGRLRFNWSHSADRALVAIARSVQPGIDLEHRPRRADRNVLALAQRFFAPVEADALGALPADERAAAFLRLWTVKEAVLKAQGRGLAYGLHRVVVDLGGSATARVHLDADSVAAWQVRELTLDPDWVAALAWRGPSMAVRWCGQAR